MTAFYEGAAIDPPFVAALTMVGAKGLTLAPHPERQSGRPLDRDPLVLPPILIENLMGDPNLHLTPSFRMFWNAFGFPFAPLD
jgi:hypothetical protein